MVGGHNTLYNNQPIQLLKKAAADSIKAGEVGGRVQMTVNLIELFFILDFCALVLLMPGRVVWL